MPTDGNIALFPEPKKKKNNWFPMAGGLLPSRPGDTPINLSDRIYLAARAICVVLEQGPRIHGTAVAGEISS